MVFRFKQLTTTYGIQSVGRAAATLAVLVLVFSAALGAGVARASVSNAAPRQLVNGLTQVMLGGLAVARDGSGGLVYSATSGGVSHVYLARLLDGRFQMPVRLDTGALTSASDPVVTADDGGQLLVAFISGGDLYAADTLSSDQSLSAPQLLATGASSPWISMNLYGVGYLAYTATDGTGSDVDVQYFDGSGWAPATPETMNHTPGDLAGAGPDAPSVVAASDGVGIVAWGEGGHVYSRRLLGTETSVEVEQDDPVDYDGLDEVAASDPRVASGGDSTYPDIVFSETFQNGAQAQTRAMLTRLVAEETQPAVAIDGLSGSPGQDATVAQVAMGELGRGLITAVTGAPATGATTTGATTTGATTTGATTTGATTTGATTTGTADRVEATVLGENGAPGTPTAVDPMTDATDPDAVPAVFGSLTSALVWDQAVGSGISQVLLSYAADGENLAAPIALSSVLDGPIQADDGLLLAGDNRGDGAAAWVQGDSGALSIDTDQLYTPPGSPRLSPATIDANVSQPTLTWKPAAEDWGPVLYTVSLNGAAVTQTTGTSVALPSALTDGTDSWSVTASNTQSQSATSGTGKLVIDTYAPRLRLRVTGAPRVRATQRLTLAASDAPNPGEPGARASGLKSETVNWGDGTKPVTGVKLRSLTHAYTRPGLYALTVTASDDVSNTTTLTRLIRVLG